MTAELSNVSVIVARLPPHPPGHGRVPSFTVAPQNTPLLGTGKESDTVVDGGVGEDPDTPLDVAGD